MYKKIWLDNVISLEVIHDYTRSSPCVIFCISNSISISIKLSRIGENEVEFEKKKETKTLGADLYVWSTTSKQRTSNESDGFYLSLT